MTTKTSMHGLLELMPIQGPGQIDSLNLDYKVTVSLKGAIGADGTSTIGLEIILERLRSQVFIENIAPSGFLVLVSWVF